MAATTAPIIRNATRADIDTILKFIEDLASFEKALDSVVATPERLEQTLFSGKPDAHGLICEQDGKAVGFAIYFYSYSTWRAQKGLFLEDLYVTPDARGHGVGRSLLSYLARLAVETDCARFEWNVLNWNEKAIKVYQGVGGRPQDEWTTYRLEGESLFKLANDSPATSSVAREPLKVIADLCVVPMGVGVSVSKYVTACERVIEEAGLEHKLHAYGTNIEGNWDDVFAAIKRCHEVVHDMGAPRINTTIKAGTRTDRTQTMQDKIDSVEEKLAIQNQ